LVRKQDMLMKTVSGRLPAAPGLALVVLLLAALGCSLGGPNGVVKVTVSVPPTLEPIKLTPTPRKPTDTAQVRVTPPTLTPLPPPELTASAAPTPVFKVSGGVVLQDGACCIGGIVGPIKPLKITYQASSPEGAVTEMRTAPGGGCKVEADLSAAPWRLFVSQEQQQMAISAINWVGYYWRVQYRDSQGNLSAVYCDDISVEGAPAPPTP
jgi:hypothetical protein